jgi:ABC-type transport system involved in multi-copper enzyme maturation permease subunit
MMKSDIGRLIGAEILKAKKLRSTYVLTVLILVMAMVSFFGFRMAAGNRLIGVLSGFFLSSAAGGWMVRMISLLSVVITAFVISNEFSLGTVKPCWAVPVERRSWLTAKIIWVCSLVTILFLVTMVVILALSAFTVGFEDLMEKDYLVHSSGSLWLRLVLTCGLQLWTLWSVVVVTSLVAVIFNRPGITIAVVMVAGIALVFLDMFSTVRPFLLTTWISLPIDQMSAMAKGLPLPLPWGELVWKALLAGGVWMGVSLLTAVKVITAKEITF